MKIEERIENIDKHFNEIKTLVNKHKEDRDKIESLLYDDNIILKLYNKLLKLVKKSTVILLGIVTSPLTIPAILYSMYKVSGRKCLSGND